MTYTLQSLHSATNRPTYKQNRSNYIIQFNCTISLLQDYQTIDVLLRVQQPMLHLIFHSDYRVVHRIVDTFLDKLLIPSFPKILIT